MALCGLVHNGVHNCKGEPLGCAGGPGSTPPTCRSSTLLRPRGCGGLLTATLPRRPRRCTGALLRSKAGQQTKPTEWHPLAPTQVSLHHVRLTPHRVTLLDCCFDSSSLRLLLDTKAPVMTPNSISFSLLFLHHVPTVSGVVYNLTALCSLCQ